jgi:hypothetical protein
MEIGEKGLEPGRPFLKALRGDTDEHSSAVAFHQLKDLISGLCGVFSAGLILIQEV